MFNLLKKSKSLLGMNARNLMFIRPGATKAKIRLVDDKLKTKRLLHKSDLPVAKLYSKIANWQDFANFDWAGLPDSYVLKPCRGLGGEGIIVTFGRKKNGNWVLPNNREAGLRDIMTQVSDILDGDYSITSTADTAFFEERIKIHPSFKLYAYKGVPDIRIVVYNKVPVMAMLRLPTKESNGKANLHIGGIGAGVDILTGETTYAVQKTKMIEYLPGTQFKMRGIKIPYWEQILQIAVDAQIACGLNYTGVDVAIDRERGPIILELNARPGLQIQVANLAGLKERLLRIKGLKIPTMKKGVQVGKELFGGEVEQEVEEKTGRQVIGIIEKIKVAGKNKQQIELKAKVDTGAGISAIDESLARELGYDSAIKFYKAFNIKDNLTVDEMEALSQNKMANELTKHPDIVDVVKVISSHGCSYRMEVPLKLIIAGITVMTKVSVINREHLEFPMIIGRRDLKRFLVDPAK